MDDLIGALSDIFSALFIVGTMASIGFGFSSKELFKPLSNGSLVVRMLIANFVLTPLFAFLIVSIIPLDNGLKIGLAILALTAGAPIIPKLAEIAKEDVATGVGIMFLLVVATLVGLPLLLPLVLQGVEVDGVQITKTMVMSIMLPLAIAMAIRWRWPDVAREWQPVAKTASNIGLVGAFITLVTMNFSEVVGLFGSGAIIAMVLFILGAFGSGYVMGFGKEKSNALLFGMSTGQRNIAAAFIVAASSFSAEKNALIMVILGSVLMQVILFLIAGEFGKRKASTEPAPDTIAERPVAD